MKVQEGFKKTTGSERPDHDEICEVYTNRDSEKLFRPRQTKYAGK